MNISDQKSVFEKLFDETGSMIYNLGLRLFNNVEDARDFSQDVYLQAFAKLESFKKRSKFSTWLYALALNYGLKKISREKRLKVNYDSNKVLEESDSREGNYSDESQPNDYHNDDDTDRQIRDELRFLPEKLRLPLVLYYYEKLSYQEIAKKLALKEGTLKTYIFKGKQQLSDRLKKRGIRP